MQFFAYNVGEVMETGILSNGTSPRLHKSFAADHTNKMVEHGIGKCRREKVLYITCLLIKI